MNHHRWLDQHFIEFATHPKVLGSRFSEEYLKTIRELNCNDCESYRNLWHENGIPFAHGVAMYLLLCLGKYDLLDEDAGQWIVEFYDQFRPYFPAHKPNDVRSDPQSRHNRSLRRLRSAYDLCTMLKNNVYEAEADLYTDGSNVTEDERNCLTVVYNTITDLEQAIVDLQIVIDDDEKKA